MVVRTGESESRHILELLSRPTAGRARFVTPRGLQETSFSRLWEQSSRVKPFLARLSRGAVAGVLTPSPEMVAFMVGCLRAGRDFVSLPLPGRAQDAASYGQQLRMILGLAGASTLVVEGTYAHLLRSIPVPLPCPLLVVEELMASGASGGEIRSLGDPEPGDLIQFSSGTTGVPKGIRLTGAAIGASVQASLDALGVGETPEVCCGWIPLSHDMGLMGGLLGSWVGSTLTGPGYLYVCLSPEMFLARPLVWMEACSTYRATCTMGPTFAYNIMSRHLGRASDLDLSSMRAAIVGAEPIRGETLASFASAASPHGFREQALCPGYGLAEATLTVSLLPPEEPWTTRTLTVDGRRATYVSCGRILDCVRVDAPEADAGAGPLTISGPAVCSEIIRASGTTRGGRVETGDLGVLADGELYVTGRSDDLICVAGRKVFAWELESAACSLPAVREGDCAVFADGRGRYAALLETRDVAREELDALLGAVRAKLASFAGIGPSAVGCLPKGMLPKTPSGKIRRNRLAAALDDLSRTCLAYKEF
jgi:acyl-CoA synthetase (AMP-forming)/AMP-acid ligase II